MSTQNYQDHREQHEHSGQPYKHLEWGTNGNASRPPSNSHHTHLHHVEFRSHTDHYEHTPEQPFTVNVDYSQVAAVETGFKKLKSNQIEVLKELKREYQVLRNTQLEVGLLSTHRPPTESVESIDESVSKSQSDARSSSFSRPDRTRKKSHNKELQMAALQRKQMELMLNNSMKKIEQLLASEIDLKRTVSQLRNKLDSRESSEEEHEYTIKKYKDEIEHLTRMLEDARKDCENFKSKSKDTVNSLGSLEGEIAISHLQIKKKDDRIRALEEEIYLQKNKYCNLELDLKKYKLEADLLERNHKEQVSLLQRRLSSMEEHHIKEKQQEVRKLNNEIDLKEERYRLVLEHLNKEKEEKQDLVKQKGTFVDNPQDKEYIKQLQDLVASLKAEKQRKALASEQVLSSLLEKMSTLNSQPNEQLKNQIRSLKKELGVVQSHAYSNITEEELQQKIRQLEQSIEEQDEQKMYFFEDLKKIRDQLVSQRKGREQAQSEVKQLKDTLRRVEQEATKYSYQLKTLRHMKEMDLTQNQNKSKSIMFKSQMLQNRQIQIAQIRDQMANLVDQHRRQVNQYEQDLKIVKRQLAEEEVKNYKIKEELQLKITLLKTQHQAEMNRYHEELDKVKKGHASELNDHFNQKIVLEDKLLEKTQQYDKVNSELMVCLKEKQSYYQQFKAEQDGKVKSIQDEHTNSMNQLATKLEGLAQLNNQHLLLVQRNSWLQQELQEMKRISRLNRNISQGVDHLWSVKQAEYSNIDSILKAIQ